MNGIRVIAVVLSMVLLLVGASGNTKDTGNKAVSYESIKKEETKVCLAMNVLTELGTIYIEEGEKEAALTEENGLGETVPEEGNEETGNEDGQKEDPADARLPEEETPDSEAQTEEPPQIEESAPAAAESSGQWIVAVSQEDYDALLRIVECEASGQDIKGRMLVANVVLNRLNSGRFGGSIKEVIYQRVNGKAQFSPVSSGKINRITVTPETVEAVDRALCGEDESQGALYFASRAYANPENMAWFDRNLTWLFAYSGHEFFR